MQVLVELCSIFRFAFNEVDKNLKVSDGWTDRRIPIGHEREV